MSVKNRRRRGRPLLGTEALSETFAFKIAPSMKQALASKPNPGVFARAAIARALRGGGSVKRRRVRRPTSKRKSRRYP